MGMLALRIPDKLKREMNHIKINWSETLRNAIHEIIESDKKRTLLKRIQVLAKAQKTVKSGTAASLIRSMRDHA